MEYKKIIIIKKSLAIAIFLKKKNLWSALGAPGFPIYHQ